MPEIMGKAFFKNGRRLLRHDGGGGNMVPLIGPEGIVAQLKDGEVKDIRRLL